jgi:hypothetical protein
VQTFIFTHVGGGGTGKVYKGHTAEKAAKKAWRDSKQLAEVRRARRRPPPPAPW